MQHCMEELALSFPSLRGVIVASAWDARAFDKWASGPAPCHGARCAARFVLWVWNPKTRWRCGSFELQEALCCWDDEHRAAFVAWASTPWWP